MSNQYTVTAPVVEELKEIDANLNELETELDSLTKDRDKRVATKGKYSLDSFKETKSVNKDIEDLEKVIALAYQERKEIAESVFGKYTQGLLKDTLGKRRELENEAKKIYENKTFPEVAAALGTDFSRLLDDHVKLYAAHNGAMMKLIKVLGVEVSADVRRSLILNEGFGGVREYLYSVARAVDEWLEEELRMSGQREHKFKIKD